MITFYGTGFRNATVSNATVRVNGGAVTVVSVGPEGTPGLDQITIALPNEDTTFWDSDESPSAVDVVLSINGVLANRAWLLFTLTSFTHPAEN